MLGPGLTSFEPIEAINLVQVGRLRSRCDEGTNLKQRRRQEQIDRSNTSKTVRQHYNRSLLCFNSFSNESANLFPASLIHQNVPHCGRNTSAPSIASPAQYRSHCRSE